MSQKRWLNVMEVCKEFGVSRQTVQGAVSQGTVDSRVIDGARLVSRETAALKWPKQVTAEKEVAAQNSPGQTEAESRRVEAYWRAHLRETAAKKARGEVIGVADVRTQVFERFRILRDAAFQIPDRVAPELVSETDPLQLSIRLRRELEKVFENFSLGKLETSADPDPDPD